MPENLENSALAVRLEKIRFHSNPKEEQRKIRKPSSVINAKKQRKTTEWKNTKDHFKKIRDTKATFHAKMGQ